MSLSSQKIKYMKKNKNKEHHAEENLNLLSKEELIEKVEQLQAHNKQLKNILEKKTDGGWLKEKQTQSKSAKRKFQFDNVSKRHVLLKFYYLGWDRSGYVSQEDTNNTIEYDLFAALEKCCLIESREKCNYNRCGRTDKGVSAFSQVISLDLRSKFEEPSEENAEEELPYCTMLNRLLPPEVRCYSWCHVGATTSARFDCSARTYKYYFPKANLDIKAMEEGSQYLVGTHDFRNLCKMDVGNGVTEFVRHISSVAIRPCADSDEHSSAGYDMFQLVIRGTSFLWHQIRCIMSVLLLVGEGKEEPEVVKHLLNVNENPCKPQYSLASSLPLNLFAVDYEKLRLKWNFEQNNLIQIVKLLQRQWTYHSVKSAMIKDMIEQLEEMGEERLEVRSQAESLQEGVKAKVYTPLIQRTKCQSLEEKISHYIKKRRIEVVEEI